MKERPILFSTPMVQAILDRNKTMTRRVVNPQPKSETIGYCMVNKTFIGGGIEWQPQVGFDPETEGIKHPDSCATGKSITCPFGVPGDLLWVRETWALLGGWEGDVPVHEIDGDNVIYFQEHPDFRWVDGDGFTEYTKSGDERSHWKPSIFMPKKYCRIWLKVKSVRVERLQEITWQDAQKEGYAGDMPMVDSVSWFLNLWDSLNGKPRANGQDISWATNPWVWVVEFERTDRSQATNTPCVNTKCGEYIPYDSDGSNCNLFFPANKDQCEHYRPQAAREG